jgi:hypothetical protein
MDDLTAFRVPHLILLVGTTPYLIGMVLAVQEAKNAL